MKQLSTTDRPGAASYLTAAVLALVPFHAFLTIWLSSAFGHYTAFRLWSAVLLLVLVVMAAVVLWRDRAMYHRFRAMTLWQLIALYAALSFVLGVAALATGAVTVTALGYGLLSNLRYLAFFFALAVIAYKQSWLRRHWQSLILWPAAIVSIFAVLQYLVLPADFLTHFGYNGSTINPISTINNNPEYPRVMSTLRGANPLGAYLVVVLGLIAALFVSGYKRRLVTVLGVLSAGALLFSFSRSAWLGTCIALGTVAVVSLQTKHSRRILIAGAGVLVLLAAIGLYLSQHNAALQNALYHTEDKSTVSVSSNDSRESALKRGARDVVHEPFGRGPGSAGPASIYNTGQPTRLAENYYLQIGQELGWIGLVLFVAIQVLVLLALWRGRSDPLSLGLFASAIGLVLVNLLSHAWTDDTLAFLWWGLSGIALSRAYAHGSTHETS